jgi:23S rRNA (guanosine2251-2'-O)-methyltransferase
MSLDQLIDQSLSDAGHKVIAVLDQVADPHNLGAVLRAAEGAGIDGVVATRDNSSPITPAVVRASAGAANFVPLVHTTNLQRTLAELKSRGYWIVGMHLDEKAQNLYEAQIPSPCALVLGAEGQGLRRLTQRECDLTLLIPMCGVLESLNVSQAAAVVFYELHRRESSQGS